ncbi:MAG: NAD-dependent epimerase/dehydratase family protein [Anaerolineaceae bacterium]|nr:NAD-dependent epimerase/dehydratase family protein [Anaerolineaceae bacterium]
MKCFVTGAAGFLGTALSNRLIREGHEVIGLDDCSGAEPLRLLPDVKFVRNDLNSKESLWRLLKDVDVIFHLAAKVIVPDSLLYPGEYERTNVGGTVTLLEAMHDVGNRKMVFASSGAVYGNQPVMPLSEEMLPRPESPYAVSKLAGELYIRTIGQLWGLQAVCLRIFNCYGPYQGFSFAHSPVIPTFLRQCALKGTVVIHGDGTKTRDFVYVDDVVDAFVSAAALEDSDETLINIGSGHETSVNEVLELAQKITGVEPQVVHNPRRVGGANRMCADLGIAEKKLNYKPKVMLEDGMRMTFEADENLKQ